MASPHRNGSSSALAAMCLAALASIGLPARAQVLIDTTSNWDGAYTIGSLCGNGAYGQTFTLDAPATVQGFSFYMKTTPPPPNDEFMCSLDPAFCSTPWDPVTVRAQLLAWDSAGVQPVGPVLYESAATTTTTDTLTEIAFQTGELSLPPGTYVAVINAAGLGNTDAARGDIGIVPWYEGDPYNGGSWIDAYPGGDWVFAQCTDAVDPTQYPTPWYTQGVAMDTAFTLQGMSEPLCPDLTDASGNGIPDVVDAQCPCVKRQSRTEYAACVASELYALVLDGCLSELDLSRANQKAARQGCR